MPDMSLDEFIRTGGTQEEFPWWEEEEGVVLAHTPHATITAGPPDDSLAHSLESLRAASQRLANAIDDVPSHSTSGEAASGPVPTPDVSRVVADYLAIKESLEREQVGPDAISFQNSVPTITAGQGLHPLSQRLVALMQEAADLHVKKSADYGSEKDPFANLKAAEEFGVPNWVGGAIRANDKMKRIMSFARKGVLANESVLDAFTDLAVYALICRVLYEESSGLLQAS